MDPGIFWMLRLWAPWEEFFNAINIKMLQMYSVKMNQYPINLYVFDVTC